MAARAQDRAGNPLCMLAVHAHPDDEASKGAGTVAKYVDEGIRSVLVCCTGGEAGDILNPAADTPDVRANLAEIRMDELRASGDGRRRERLRRPPHARLPRLRDARHGDERAARQLRERAARGGGRPAGPG